MISALACQSSIGRRTFEIDFGGSELFEALWWVDLSDVADVGVVLVPCVGLVVHMFMLLSRLVFA